MTNVVNLAGEPVREKGTLNPSLVKALEQLLEQAKAGVLQNFIGTGFVADGARMSVWVDHHDNVYEMLGSLAWLQYEYVHRHTGGGPDE